MKRLVIRLLSFVFLCNTGCSSKCKIAETKSNTAKETKTIVDGHEFVDLGLPSGIKWATCNIGATKPFEFGDHFAWGETTKKTDYSWSTYKWCENKTVVNFNIPTDFTKYNNSSKYGIVDDKKVLEPEDDAATVNWGSSWRMPSYEEFEEMYTGCQWEHDYDYEGTKVFVYVGTSKKNGNKIIIPYSGEYEKTQYNSLYTSFWTSTYFENAPYIGRCFLFYEPYLGYSGERCYGKNIRAVVK